MWRSLVSDKGGTGTTDHMKKDKLAPHVFSFQQMSSAELRARKSICPSINCIMGTWPGVEELQDILQGKQEGNSALRRASDDSEKRQLSIVPVAEDPKA